MKNTFENMSAYGIFSTIVTTIIIAVFELSITLAIYSFTFNELFENIYDIDMPHISLLVCFFVWLGYAVAKGIEKNKESKRLENIEDRLDKLENQSRRP